MFTKLPSNSERILNELVQADNPTELLCDKVNAVTGKDEEELMGIIRELKQEGYIDVEWADNLPYIVTLNNSARTYNEQLTEYERQIQAYQSKGTEKKIANKERVAEFIQRGERIGKEEYHSAGKGHFMPGVSGSQYEKWKNDIYTFTERYTKSHPLHDDILNSKGRINEYSKLMGYLQSLVDDEEFWEETTFREKLAMYDVFISHANKDKNEYVNELKESLDKLRINIFYDKDILEWGDKWKDKILEGVKKAEFAIIVISENFFDREWTEKELNEFLNRQNANGQKIILPILHNITPAQLKEKYPDVADILALSSSDHSCDEIALLFAGQLIKRLKA